MMDLTVSRYSKLKISDLNLSPKALQECFLTDFNNIGRLIYELWGEFLNLVSLYPNPAFYRKLEKEYVESERNRFIVQNTRVVGGSPKAKISTCKTLFMFNNR